MAKVLRWHCLTPARRRARSSESCAWNENEKSADLGNTWRHKATQTTNRFCFHLRPVASHRADGIEARGAGAKRGRTPGAAGGAHCDLPGALPLKCSTRGRIRVWLSTTFFSTMDNHSEGLYISCKRDGKGQTKPVCTACLAYRAWPLPHLHSKHTSSRSERALLTVSSVRHDSESFHVL